MDQPKHAASRGEIKHIRALAQRKNREALGLFVAEGVRVVEDLLASELEVQLVVATSTAEDTPRRRALLRAVASRGVPLRWMTTAELTGVAATDTPQGVLAVAHIPVWDYATLGACPQDAVFLILDAVQDPGNFGTLVRTAEALGAAGVLSLPGTVDTWNPKAVRSAAGSSFRLPVLSTQWGTAAPWLRGQGCRIIAATLKGQALPSLQRHDGRSALVVGNEGSGVSPDTFAHVDMRVAIPLRGRAESLNVGAAAAILLYELLRPA